MSDVFISYVHEDKRFVEFLAGILKANGMNVWLDKEKLSPGARWKTAIREAIGNGAFFISVHSKQREARVVSYANEELTLAIDEIRKRSTSTTWFIPVVIDDCMIQNREIGGGETLGDLQRCDLTNWPVGIAALLSALGVKNPVLEQGEPLAVGLPSLVEISSGFVRYDILPELPHYMQGLEFRVSKGWCQRQPDGRILAYIETVAPMKVIQELNKVAGLSGFYALSFDERISEDPLHPTVFSFQREYLLPQGTTTIDIRSGETITLPFDFILDTFFRAEGVISGTRFAGKFLARITSKHPNVPLHQLQEGKFELNFVPALLRP